MSRSPGLNADGEAAWLRLKKHLEWAEQFSLGFVFTAHPLVVSLFRERLADIYRARVTRLVSFDLDAPEQLLDEVLPRLLSPRLHEQALSAPCWLDLSHHMDEDWTRSRLDFLARLNEHREGLRTALGRPLVLILPAAERDRIRGLVPDIWAIRSFVVDTGAWIAEPVRPTDPTPHPPPPAPFPLSPHEAALVDEWHRLQAMKAEDRSVLTASLRAARVLLTSARHPEAQETAQAGLDIARRILERVGETPEALRDISVSLDNVGKTEQALGRWEQARDLYKESLDIARRILERVGETPEALRDISVSLNNVGKTEQALGRWEKARDMTREALEIGRHLSVALPDHMDYSDLASHFQKRLVEIDKAEQDSAESDSR